MVNERHCIYLPQNLHSTLVERRKDVGIDSIWNKSQIIVKLINHIQRECQEQATGHDSVLVFERAWVM